jgi:hypothetical protein
MAEFLAAIAGAAGLFEGAATLAGGGEALGSMMGLAAGTGTALLEGAQTVGGVATATNFAGKLASKLGVGSGSGKKVGIIPQTSTPTSADTTSPEAASAVVTQDAGRGGGQSASPVDILPQDPQPSVGPEEMKEIPPGFSSGVAAEMTGSDAASFKMALDTINRIRSSSDTNAKLNILLNEAKKTQGATPTPSDPSSTAYTAKVFTVLGRRGKGGKYSHNQALKDLNMLLILTNPASFNGMSSNKKKIIRNRWKILQKRAAQVVQDAQQTEVAKNTSNLTDMLYKDKPEGRPSEFNDDVDEEEETIPDTKDLPSVEAQKTAMKFARLEHAYMVMPNGHELVVALRAYATGRYVESEALFNKYSQDMARFGDESGVDWVGMIEDHSNDSNTSTATNAMNQAESSTMDDSRARSQGRSKQSLNALVNKALARKRNIIGASTKSRAEQSLLHRRHQSALSGLTGSLFPFRNGMQPPRRAKGDPPLQFTTLPGDDDDDEDDDDDDDDGEETDDFDDDDDDEDDDDSVPPLERVSKAGSKRKGSPTPTPGPKPKRLRFEEKEEKEGKRSDEAGFHTPAPTHRRVKQHTPEERHRRITKDRQRQLEVEFRKILVQHPEWSDDKAFINLSKFMIDNGSSLRLSKKNFNKLAAKRRKDLKRFKKEKLRAGTVKQDSPDLPSPASGFERSPGQEIKQESKSAIDRQMAKIQKLKNEGAPGFRIETEKDKLRAMKSSPLPASASRKEGVSQDFHEPESIPEEGDIRASQVWREGSGGAFPADPRFKEFLSPASKRRKKKLPKLPPLKDIPGRTSGLPSSGEEEVFERKVPSDEELFTRFADMTGDDENDSSIASPDELRELEDMMGFDFPGKAAERRRQSEFGIEGADAPLLDFLNEQQRKAQHVAQPPIGKSMEQLVKDKIARDRGQSERARLRQAAGLAGDRLANLAQGARSFFQKAASTNPTLAPQSEAGVRAFAAGQAASVTQSSLLQAINSNSALPSSSGAAQHLQNLQSVGEFAVNIGRSIQQEWKPVLQFAVDLAESEAGAKILKNAPLFKKIATSAANTFKSVRAALTGDEEEGGDDGIPAPGIDNREDKLNARVLDQPTVGTIQGNARTGFRIGGTARFEQTAHQKLLNEILFNNFGSVSRNGYLGEQNVIWKDNVHSDELRMQKPLVLPRPFEWNHGITPLDPRLASGMQVSSIQKALHKPSRIKQQVRKLNRRKQQASTALWDDIGNRSLSQRGLFSIGATPWHQVIDNSRFLRPAFEPLLPDTRGHDSLRNVLNNPLTHGRNRSSFAKSAALRARAMNDVTLQGRPY